MTTKHHGADEFMTGKPPGGIWAQPGFVRMQRSLHRKKKLLLAKLQSTTDPVDVEVIRQELHIIDQRLEVPPAGVKL